MTRLNSSDVPCKINTRTINSHNDFVRQLEARYDQLLTSIDNLLDMSESAAKRAEIHDARYFLDLAKSYGSERDLILSILWPTRARANSTEG